MKVKSVIIFCAILLLISVNLFADTFDQYYQKQIQIDYVEIGAPIDPTLSKLQIALPSTLFFEDGLLSRFNLNAWYLAYSPYLWPEVYFEFNTIVSFEFIQKNKFGLDFGVGTGFSLVNNTLSAPLILDFRMQYIPLEWLQLEIMLEYLMWGEGAGIDAKLNTSIKPFKFPLIIGLSIGPMGLWEGEAYSMVVLQSTISVGYIFSLEGKGL